MNVSLLAANTSYFSSPNTSFLLLTNWSSNDTRFSPAAANTSCAALNATLVSFSESALLLNASSFVQAAMNASQFNLLFPLFHNQTNQTNYVYLGHASDKVGFWQTKSLPKNETSTSCWGLVLLTGREAKVDKVPCSLRMPLLCQSLPVSDSESDEDENIELF
jgi:hypothetical protein